MSALRSPMAVSGATILAILVAAAVWAPEVAPHGPEELAGPAFQLPSRQHLLGTNHLGQDILSQIVWGTRRSLSVAVGAASVSVVLGILVGAGAGLLGGAADGLAMRVVDVFLGVPQLPLLILAGALVGADGRTLIVLIAVITWPVVARKLRAQASSLRHRGFIGAARGFGGGLGYLLRRHLVPALGPLVASSFVMVASNAVLLEASLAFLGLADPTGVSWGLMLNDALLQPGLYFNPIWPWWVLPTGFAITLAILGFTFLGVALEPVVAPRTATHRSSPVRPRASR